MIVSNCFLFFCSLGPSPLSHPGVLPSPSFPLRVFIQVRVRGGFLRLFIPEKAYKVLRFKS